MSASENILQGPASIHVAVFTDALVLPTAADIAALEAGTFAGFSAVGHTTSATAISDKPTIVDATSQQATRALDSFVTGVETHLTSTAREATLAVLTSVGGLRAEGSAAAGRRRGRTTKLAVALVGPWPGGTALVVAERCVVVSDSGVSFDNDNPSDFPLDLKVLEGKSLADGWILYPVLDSDI